MVDVSYAVILSCMIYLVKGGDTSKPVRKSRATQGYTKTSALSFPNYPRSASHHETKLKILALTDGMLCVHTPSQRTDFRRSPGPDPFCDHCGITVLQRFRASALQPSSFKLQGTVTYDRSNCPRVCRLREIRKSQSYSILAPLSFPSRSQAVLEEI